MMLEEFKVENAVRKGKLAPQWKLPLEKLLHSISCGPHRLAANYLPENMDLAGHLSFDLLINQRGDIVSFAGVYNGGRYPEGVYRILNRTWVAESLRVGHGLFPFLTSKHILPVQIENLRDELKLIFVSREELSGKYFLRKWRDQQPDADLWRVSDKMVQVVPEVSKASCFQYICSRQISPVEWNPAEISETEWALL